MDLVTEPDVITVLGTAGQTQDELRRDVHLRLAAQGLEWEELEMTRGDEPIPRWVYQRDGRVMPELLRRAVLDAAAHDVSEVFGARIAIASRSDPENGAQWFTLQRNGEFHGEFVVMEGPTGITAEDFLSALADFVIGGRKRPWPPCPRDGMPMEDVSRRGDDFYWHCP